MLKSLGPLPRFILGLACFLMLLALTGALWRWLPVRPFATLDGQADDCKRLRISANGRFLLAVHNTRLAVWDLETRREVARSPYRWVANDPALQAVWLSPDGNQVAFIDGTAEPSQVCLWNRTRDPAPVGVTRLPDCWSIPETLAANPTLVTHGKGGYRLWDAAGAKEIPLPPTSPEASRTIQLVQGRRLLVAVEEQQDKGWLLNPFRLIVWKDLTGAVEKVVIPGASLPTEASPDGQMLAVTIMNRTYLYDLHSSRLVAELPPPEGDRIESPQVFSPDSRLLVTTPDLESVDNRHRVVPGQHLVWDVSVLPPRKRASLAVTDIVSPPMFAPNGQWAAIWDRSNRNLIGSHLAFWGCQILDTQNWQPQGQIPPELSLQPMFAPDSRTIAGAVVVQQPPGWLEQWIYPSRGGIPFPAIKVWEVPTGRELAALRDGVCFAYFADGNRMAVGHNDGRIAMWDIPPRRAGWVDYGLPVVFVLLVFLGVRFVWRTWRRPSAVQAAPVAADTMSA
jgi:WD40 repeat protein